MLEKVAEQVMLAVGASKCHRCRCFHDAVAGLEASEAPAELETVLAAARAVLVGQQYDCLGCDPCWPAVALDAAGPRDVITPAQICATAPVVIRDGWPPLPGDYRVLRFAAPIAVCALHSRKLGEAIRQRRPTGLSIVGSLETENLGIERLVANVTANPHIRRLLLCGEDSARQVGHFPGQSLVALIENGIDQDHRIIGARGRRPLLPNLDASVVEHFRRQVEIIDRRGVEDADALAALIAEQAAHAPAPMDTVPDGCPRVEAIEAGDPAALVLDPAGYVVISIDRQRGILLAEHYRNSGVLDLLIRGKHAMNVMAELLGRSLVSRLDHAAYLGKELARAEEALRKGTDYRQDAAPEPPTSGAEQVTSPSGCASSS